MTYDWFPEQEILLFHAHALKTHLRTKENEKKKPIVFT